MTWNVKPEIKELACLAGGIVRAKRKNNSAS